jgi:putative hemolysin
MDSSPWPGVLSAALASVPSFTGTDWILLIVLLVALLFAATSAAAETALTSVSRIKIRNLAEEGDARAKRVLRLIEKPQLFLSTILVVSNVSVIVASTMATLLAIRISANFGEVISTVLLSLIVLIFCEITPKTAAVQNPEDWARVLAGPIEWLSKLLRWLIAALTWITSGIVRLLGGQTVRRGPFVTEEELRLLVEVGEEEGVLEEEEREMIHNVFELADTSVREVMVPRIDMVTVEADAPVEVAMRLIVQGGQSRIPVYDGSIDNIIGVLYAKDLLRIFASGQQPSAVRTLVRPAYFVPESKRLDDLLRELQQQRVHMAIVVDEYGAVAGLVTIEDLVEEIIGDIQDEYDREEQLFERVSENEYIVDAKISLDDFNELLDTDLTGHGYETLGGFVYSQLDKIPTVGDTVTFENLTITVLGTKGRRVTKVKVVRRVEDERGDEGADTGTSSPALPSPPSRPPLALPAPASAEQTQEDEQSAEPDDPSGSQRDEPARGDVYSRPLRARGSVTRRHGRGSAQPRRHV